MTIGWWHDDGDGLSYTLWESHEKYNDYSAELYGQADYRLNTDTMKRGWRANASISEAYPVVGWFDTKYEAMNAVDRAIKLEGVYSIKEKEKIDMSKMGQYAVDSGAYIYAPEQTMRDCPELVEAEERMQRRKEEIVAIIARTDLPTDPFGLPSRK